MQTTVGRLVKLAITTTTLAVTVPLLATAPTLAAGNNMAKIDIVAEGIDLAPIYVDANANGYTSTETKAHRFLVRVFAKAAGQKRVWKVRIEGEEGKTLFEKNVGRSEGWDVYGKSHEVMAKPQSVLWKQYPVNVCRENMDKMIAAGKTKAQVLSNDRKVTATAAIIFSAWADTKANNKKNDHEVIYGLEEHTDMVFYPVQVVCRAAL